MYYLTTTRFDENTWNENKIFRKMKNISCIYGTPMRIKSSIPVKSDLFVIEMNNTTNKIKGIGLIINYVHVNNKFKIYKDNNYNRYIYCGNVRLNIIELSESEKEIMNILEQLLFKGSKHCKRAQGICEIPIWLKKNKSNVDFVNIIKNMFEKRNLINK
jgi:hypothetical protein